MSIYQEAHPHSLNRLLASLPSEELIALQPHLEQVSLANGQPVILPNEPIPFVYFPLNSLLSLVTVMEDGSTVEAGAIGREGMAGLPIFLDAGTTPMQTLTQILGQAVRVKAEIIKETFNKGGALRHILHRYIHTIIVVTSQSAACNRLHPLKARLCRWLLMSSDGVNSEELFLTHDFLATMLGVRRAGVSEAASQLQSQGWIRYQRGRIQIVDRKSLETASCECYEVVRAEYQRLFG